MTDEGRSRPLPQRERGATEAGAKPAATPAGPRVLPNDLRQRMHAAVEAERAQARERVAEVLRHPPQRGAVGTPPSSPAPKGPDGDQAGESEPPATPGRRRRFERRGKDQRAVGPDAAASSGPNAIAPSDKNETAVNSAAAEPVSPARPESAPAYSAPASVPAPAMGSGHPSGPVAAWSAFAPPEAAPPEAAPPEAVPPEAIPPEAAQPAAPPQVAPWQEVEDWWADTNSQPPAAASPPPSVRDQAAGYGLPAAHAQAPGQAQAQGQSAGLDRAEPAWPYAGELQPVESPTPVRRRWAKTGLVVGALAVVAAGSAGAVTVLSKSSPHQAAGSSTGVVTAGQAAAASWVVSQVNPKTVVSCDQTMCAALVAHGYPPNNLRKLGSTSALKASRVVIVTRAAQHLFGSSLATAWAPDALATFGSGSSAVSVRVVAPDGAAAYRKAASKDRAKRKTSEAALTQAKSITISAAAGQDLKAGQVDGRLVDAIADAAAAQPINIVEFGNTGPGASADVLLRYADLAASNPVANMGVGAYVRSLRAGMNGGPGPRPDRTELLTLPGGQQVLRVEFTAPSPFGVLSGP